MFQFWRPSLTKPSKSNFGSIKNNLRHSSSVKYPLIVIIFTFCAIKLIIVDETKEWKEDTPRDVAPYILPGENTTILFPRKLECCSKDELQFLFVVCSDPKMSERRNAIRATWGEDHTHGIKTGLVFLMGLTRDSQVNNDVLAESQQHGDILLENFYESYLNLTIKSLMMVKFVAHLDKKPEYIFKIDDDTFLNVAKLSEVYHSSQLANKISGMILENTKPIRWSTWFNGKESRWICPKWMFPDAVFPTYVTGLGYIFPSSMAKCLLEKSLSTLLIPFEDLFLTGILADKCGFQKSNTSGFSIKRIDPCTYEDEIMLTHDVEFHEQMLMQDIFSRKSRDICEWTM